MGAWHVSAGTPLIAAFNGEAQVVAYGVNYARTVALFYCLLAFSPLLRGLLRGPGPAGHPQGDHAGGVVRAAYHLITPDGAGSAHHPGGLLTYPLTWGISSVLFALCLARLRFRLC